MNIFIRSAATNDAPLIADISRQTFYDTFAPDNKKEDMDKFLSEQFTRDTLMMEVGLRENIFFLAYAEDEVAGYLKLREGRKPEAFRDMACLEIARIYVLKKFIGTGVGRLLMQTSIDTAIQKQKELIWLGVWEKNEKAIKFYSNWGFEKFGETSFMLGDDLQQDWLMKKHLTGSLPG